MLPFDLISRLVKCQTMADIEKPDTVNEVLTPALLVDIDRAKKNAQKMINICENFGVQLRPHMKTHKTVLVHKNLYVIHVYLIYRLLKANRAP